MLPVRTTITEWIFPFGIYLVRPMFTHTYETYWLQHHGQRCTGPLSALNGPLHTRPN